MTHRSCSHDDDARIDAPPHDPDGPDSAFCSAPVSAPLAPSPRRSRPPVRDPPALRRHRDDDERHLRRRPVERAGAAEGPRSADRGAEAPGPAAEQPPGRDQRVDRYGHEEPGLGQREPEPSPGPGQHARREHPALRPGQHRRPREPGHRDQRPARNPRKAGDAAGDRPHPAQADARRPHSPGRPGRPARLRCSSRCCRPIRSRTC